MFPVQIISRKRILLENATLCSLLAKYNKEALKNSIVVSHSGDFWQKAEELSLKSPEHTVFYLWEASDVTAQPQIFVKRRERKQALLGTQELKPVKLSTAQWMHFYLFRYPFNWHTLHSDNSKPVLSSTDRST